MEERKRKQIWTLYMIPNDFYMRLLAHRTERRNRSTAESLMKRYYKSILVWDNFEHSRLKYTLESPIFSKQEIHWESCCTLQSRQFIPSVMWPRRIMKDRTSHRKQYERLIQDPSTPKGRRSSQRKPVLVCPSCSPRL